MKYYIIVNIFIFLFLNACTPDFKSNPEFIKYLSNEKNSKSNSEVATTQKEKAEKEKAEILNNLINSIESANEHKKTYIKKMEKEPSDQYGISAFNDLSWTGLNGETISSNTDRSVRYRRRVYALLSLIDDNELKEFSNIISIAGIYESLLATFNYLGGAIDNSIDFLHPKKDALDKLDISDLKNLKKSFDTILSTIKFVSETAKQILLDYQTDKNLIKTDVSKLRSHLNTLYDQMKEKVEEARKQEKDILSNKQLFL
ncbi:CRASP family complement regulator-acquiring lipoprotein [Borreliella japonica]|uniref:CRASP family complement regulator-acquiring lipoprotein n=1 Tax=Borreliella japonica TaxID=34095 RepID=UPI003AEFD643